jgi:hypothetical protein
MQPAKTSAFGELTTMHRCMMVALRHFPGRVRMTLHSVRKLRRGLMALAIAFPVLHVIAAGVAIA